MAYVTWHSGIAALVSVLVCATAALSVADGAQEKGDPSPPGEIRLLPGYRHVVTGGIDTVTGRIWKEGGPIISYDIGFGFSSFATPRPRDNTVGQGSHRRSENQVRREYAVGWHDSSCGCWTRQWLCGTERQDKRGLGRGAVDADVLSALDRLAPEPAPLTFWSGAWSAASHQSEPAASLTPIMRHQDSDHRTRAELRGVGALHRNGIDPSHPETVPVGTQAEAERRGQADV